MSLDAPRTRPLKILFMVHNQTQKGGAYYRGLNLAKPLARRGHDVALMTIHPSERWRTVESRLDGVRLVESPDLLWGSGRSGWDVWDAIRRTIWIRRHTLDVIHTVDTRPAVSVPALLGRRASGAVWIADWTDWWGRGGATAERSGRIVRTVVGPFEQLFEEKPRPLADGTVVISRSLRDRAQNLGVPLEDILYLPPGADPDSLRATERDAARRRLGLDEGTPYIGYLGNIYQRDADLLFAALAELTKSNAELIMVGEPGCRIGASVSHRVVVTGRQPLDTVLDYLSACDVLALPLSDTVANRGRWPSKVNEYVAVGRATVACEVGDVAEFIRAHEIGLLVRPEPGDFAAGLDKLLDDPDLARRMGERARSLAQSEYSQDSLAGRLEQFYLRVLESKTVH